MKHFSVFSYIENFDNGMFLSLLSLNNKKKI